MLAISGYIDDDEAKLLSDYGFDDYLKKPFSVTELGERVTRLLALADSKVSTPRRTAT
jgi:DNA-binding response OmpR family regulator